MAVIEQPTVEIFRAGWFPDPQGQHNLRYFDGERWTDHVTHYGPSPCTGCGYDEADISNN